jgi:hypothetical protein
MPRERRGTSRKYALNLLCNTRYTGGAFQLYLCEITLDPELQRKLILEATDGCGKDDLGRLMADGGPKIIQSL